jgi:hypothetical protein
VRPGKLFGFIFSRDLKQSEIGDLSVCYTVLVLSDTKEFDDLAHVFVVDADAVSVLVGAIWTLLFASQLSDTRYIIKLYHRLDANFYRVAHNLLDSL